MAGQTLCTQWNQKDRAPLQDTRVLVGQVDLKPRFYHVIDSLDRFNLLRNFEGILFYFKHG